MTTVLQPGQRFAGRYLLANPLGSGGFATVWQAHDLRTNQQIALKLLEPDHEDQYDAQTRARFQREAHILARLHNPHTVRLLDHGEADGRLYIVFELVRGNDLTDLLQARGRLSPGESVHIVRQVLISLREAHAVGLIHRDIKPQNIRVFEADGDPLRVKLLDFGIARASDDGAPSVTRTGEIIGTPRYMSPEQLRSQPLTPASDVYSVGMVLFELLAGEQALPGSSIYDQFDRLATEQFFGAAELQNLGALTPILKRMCARDTQDRFPSAAAVLSALDAPAPPTPRAPHPAAAPTLHSATFDTTNLGKIAAVLLVLVLFAALATLFVNNHSDDPVPVVVSTSTRELGPLTKSSDPVVEDEPVEGVDLGAPADMASAKKPRARAGAIASKGCGNNVKRTGLESFRGEHFQFLPLGYDGSEPLPLLVMLHTDYQSADGFMMATGFPDRADRDGVILLALRDANSFGGLAWRDADADVTKVVTLVEHAATKLCVDRARIFILGHGDGGRIAHRVSCRPSVTALASNSFSLADQRVLCERPVPALWLHPMHSVHLPTDRTKNCSGNVKRTPDEMEKLWRKRNKCKGPGEETVAYGDSTCKHWECEAEFEMCRLDGGVPWPGTTASGITALSGCETDVAPNFPTSDRMWDFFMRTPALTDVPESF